MKIKIVVSELKNFSYQYKGVDIETEKELFKCSFEDTTEGITEFTGAVHGLMYIKKNNLNGDVYVKNNYIKECVEKKQYKHFAKGDKASEFLRKCKMWLLDQRQTIIIYIIPEEKNIVQNETPDVSDEFSERRTWFNRD